jgi:hypothetical protein
MTETTLDTAWVYLYLKCYRFILFYFHAILVEINLLGLEYEFAYFSWLNIKLDILVSIRGRHGLDRMVVGFITTYAISAYHH